MKAGDVVEIHEDPYTRKRPEGKARVVTITKSPLDRVYFEGRYFKEHYLTVRFLSDGTEAIECFRRYCEDD